MSRAAYILDGARTPFVKAGTDFKAVSAVDLGRAAAVEAMARSGVEPGEIDQAIFGNIATPPDAANIGRVIALRAGLPKEKPAHSVSRNCASGIESIVQAARLIQTGEADVVLAAAVVLHGAIRVVQGVQLLVHLVREHNAPILRWTYQVIE